MATATMDQLISKARKRFEWLISFLIIRFRFVHQILGMMTKVATTKIESMGVTVQGGGKFVLYYNPDFMETLTDEWATYVFYHEVLHLALHHCTSRKFDNPILGNIATDLAVNELIPEIPGSCERPKDKDGNPMGQFVSEYKKNKIFSDIKEKQSSEWYYDYLKNKIKQNQGGKKGKGDKDGLGQSGMPGSQMDNHDGWKEDEVADEKVRAKVREIDRNDMWGTMSTGDKEMILAAQTRKINWRSILRQFYGNMAWKDRETTRKRPNRRTGFAHPGYKKVHVDRHLFAVDTSGSMDSELLAQLLTVINDSTEYVPIDLMQFDCDKQEGPFPFDRKKAQFEFKGRGGTDFQPVIDEAVRGHYRSLVILTDGAAPAPTQPPACRVVWVLPQDCNPPVDWGMRIHMEKHV